MKSLFLKIFSVFAVVSALSGSMALAGRYYIITNGSDGITAVSCWTGNVTTATQKAVSAGFNYCSTQYGGEPESNYEVISSGCGQSSTPVSICPYVCTAQVKTYCNTP